MVAVRGDRQQLEISTVDNKSKSNAICITTFPLITFSMQYTKYITNKEKKIHKIHKTHKKHKIHKMYIMHKTQAATPTLTSPVDRRHAMSHQPVLSKNMGFVTPAM